MLIVDFFINIYYMTYSLFDSTLTELNMIMFKKVKKMTSPDAKDTFLKEKYRWCSDPFNGALNWNWRFLRVAAVKNFRDDCDGFAFLAHWMYGDGKIYAITNYDLRTFRNWHVVYVRENKKYGSSKIYSSGRIHNMDFKEYLDYFYHDKDILTTRYY